MMKLFLLSIVFTALTGTLLAQKNLSADQQISSLEQMTGDSIKVKTLRDIGVQYSRTDLKLAETYYQRAIALGNQIQEARYTYSAYGQLALLKANTGQFDSAHYYIDFIKGKVLATKSTNIQTDYFMVEALVYKKEDRINEAIASFQKQITSLKGTGNAEINLAGAYVNLGGCYMKKGMFQKSIDYYLKALASFEKIDNKRGIAYCLHNIGDVYSELEEYHRAIPHLEKAMAIKTALKDDRGLVNSYISLAWAYLNTQNTSKAIELAGKSLVLSTKLQIGKEQSNGYLLLARCYKERRDSVNVRRNYDLALQYASSDIQADKIKIEVSRFNAGTGKITLTNPQYVLKTRLDSAIVNKDSLKIASLYQQLAVLSSGAGDYKNAFKYVMKHNEVDDAIHNPAIVGRIHDMENAFEIEKRESQIQLLQKDKELGDIQLQKKNLWLYSALIFAFLSLLIGILLINRYRIIQKARRLLELEKMRTGIARDLHDEIGSTLSSIQIMSKIAAKKAGQDTDSLTTLQRIGELSAQISESMREIVWAINPCNDNLSKTVIHMREYAAKMLEQDAIALSFEENLTTPQKVLSPQRRKDLLMIFKEAINNARKYSQASKITVSVQQLGEQLLLQIEDCGIGFDLDNAVYGNGVLNMHQRAQNMSGSFQISSGLNKGTQIQLSLPLP